jgi:hypothetical protein
MPTFFTNHNYECAPPNAFGLDAARSVTEGAFTCPGSVDGRKNPTSRLLMLPHLLSRLNPSLT